MSVCLLLIGDGRDSYHERSYTSLMERLGRQEHFVRIDDREHQLGFAGAIAEGWRQVVETGAEWVFHAEMDYLYTADVPLERMIAVLKGHTYLVQMALKRQPVNEQELDAGGIVEMAPETFTQRVEGGDIWTEHRRFFTTNPSVYSANLCRQSWPDPPESEGHFGLRLFEDPKAHSALWGAKFDPPLVTHIGDIRAGVGY